MKYILIVIVVFLFSCKEKKNYYFIEHRVFKKQHTVNVNIYDSAIVFSYKTKFNGVETEGKKYTIKYDSIKSINYGIDSIEINIITLYKD